MNLYPNSASCLAMLQAAALGVCGSSAHVQGQLHSRNLGVPIIRGTMQGDIGVI